MKYNKTYYILKRNGTKGYFVELTNACDCPYDKRLFITKGRFYRLNDIASGQFLIAKETLKELKEWFLSKGKSAYENVMKSKYFNYQERVNNFEILVREANGNEIK